MRIPFKVYQNIAYPICKFFQWEVHSTYWIELLILIPEYIQLLSRKGSPRSSPVHRKINTLVIYAIFIVALVTFLSHLSDILKN